MTDMTAFMERIPDEGETVHGRSFATGFGGKGANQAVMGAMLGAEVDVVACVGDDSFGTDAAENFAAFRIGTSELRRVDAASTGVAPIWVDAVGHNRIVIVPGANLHMTTEQIDRAFDALEAPDVVICQLETPIDCVRRALERGQAANAVTVLNPAPVAAVPIEVLRLANWVVPNESEFAGLEQQLGLDSADQALEQRIVKLAALTQANVAVTLGDRGVLLCEDHLSGHVDSVPAPPAVARDSSGAGDAFIGSFAYALGGGASGVEAAEIACLCASDSVTREGTQSSFPRAERLEELLRSANWSDAVGPLTTQGGIEGRP
jgi:ribokinase